MNEKPTHLDLFSGIGGFALAAKWAGFRTVGFCELEPFCQQVLAKNFGAIMADANATRSQGRDSGELPECSGKWTARPSSPFANTNGESTERTAIARQEHCQWLTEPAVGRVAHGIPRRVDRLKGLGNAVVPQVAQIFAKAIYNLIESDPL